MSMSLKDLLKDIKMMPARAAIFLKEVKTIQSPCSEFLYSSLACLTACSALFAILILAHVLWVRVPSSFNDVTQLGRVMYLWQMPYHPR